MSQWDMGTVVPRQGDTGNMGDMEPTEPPVNPSRFMTKWGDYADGTWYLARPDVDYAQPDRFRRAGRKWAARNQLALESCVTEAGVKFRLVPQMPARKDPSLTHGGWMRDPSAFVRAADRWASQEGHTLTFEQGPDGLILHCSDRQALLDKFGDLPPDEPAPISPSTP